MYMEFLFKKKFEIWIVEDERSDVFEMFKEETIRVITLINIIVYLYYQCCYLLKKISFEIKNQYKCELDFSVTFIVLNKFTIFSLT